MNTETVTVHAWLTESKDGTDVGTIRIGLSPTPWHMPRINRDFGIQITRAKGGDRITFTDSGMVILEVGEALLDDASDVHWNKFSPAQQAVIRLLIVGARETPILQWQRLGSVRSSTGILHDATREEAQTVQFDPVMQ